MPPSYGTMLLAFVATLETTSVNGTASCCRAVVRDALCALALPGIRVRPDPIELPTAGPS
jgi:hypothetical protein